MGECSVRIHDPHLRELIAQLTPFERRALQRYLSGVGDSVGASVFRKIKSQLKRRVRAKSFARR